MKRSLSILTSWIILVALQIPGVAVAQSVPPNTPTRDAALLNAFETMCNLELPNFEHIAAHATIMRMKLQSDTREPSAQDTVMRRKAWIGGLTSGPFFLYDDDMSGSKGVSTGCAVGGPVPDVDDFRAQAIATLKLPAEPPPEFGSDGSRSFVWTGIEGPGTVLIVRDLTPSSRPGVMVKLLAMVPRQASH